MIEGVIIEPLKQIVDDRGKVMHMLRADSPSFSKFGEIYFSQVNTGVVKAWKKHKIMTQHFAVPVGEIVLVIFDDRANSKTRGVVQKINTGEDNYCLVRIPPMVWYGFKGISKTPALIANCSDIPHDPSETIKADIADKNIPFSW
ncbi:MAG: dTDP-4-dehydrorhamnose 3,5-epimerase family protein [Elusimicrobia bacterium]|nr:dTDP-4-dehydrorhamnose 3,5-epimerase family protein [Elusimicrobiota bacterium]